MNCPSCNAPDLIETTSTYFIQLPERYVIVQNVPCRKCENCGEEFFNGAVTARIDRLLDTITTPAEEVAILDYETGK